MFSLLWTLAAQAQVQVQSLRPYVDLRDLAKHGSKQEKVDAQTLISQINSSPSSFGLPQGSYYPAQPLSAVGQSGISTIEIQNQSSAGYDLYVMYHSYQSVLLNKVSMDMYGRAVSIRTFDLLATPPTVTIDVLNRQMMISEPISGFVKFQPVGVGALINNTLGDTYSGYKSLSPSFRRAFLSRDQSTLSRIDPEYYKGRPFLRVIDQDQREHGGYTPFGIHYQISDTFMRGFISNGCFRLRDGDLFELSNIVFFSKKKGVPFVVNQSTTNGNRHPFPSIQSWFNTPKITTNAYGQYEFLKDEHGLFVFEEIRQRPVDLLQSSNSYSSQYSTPYSAPSGY
jgi:hypothetical protein